MRRRTLTLKPGAGPRSRTPSSTIAHLPLPPGRCPGRRRRRPAEQPAWVRLAPDLVTSDRAQGTTRRSRGSTCVVDASLRRPFRPHSQPATRAHQPMTTTEPLQTLFNAGFTDETAAEALAQLD